jgi:hypothetical protein
MDASKNRLGMPTEGDKEYFNKMRNMNININPGLPIEKAPGMRKKSKLTKSKSPRKKTKSKSPRKKTKSKSPRKKTPTKKQLMSDMYKRAKKDIPFLKNPKNRKEYVQKLKTIPMKNLRSMKNPIDVVNYVPQFSQGQGLRASDLGQSLVRTNRRSIDRPRI